MSEFPYTWDAFFTHQEGACDPRVCPVCEISWPLWAEYWKQKGEEEDEGEDVD